MFILLSMFTTAFSMESNDITIYINESVLSCDTAPYIENGFTMVPMRKIFEALGADVSWDGLARTITATKEATVITLEIDNPVIYINNAAEELAAAPVIKNGSTYVPLRAVSQSLGASVEWLGYKKSVYIDSPKVYNADYQSYVDCFMNGTIMAGYSLVKDFSSEHITSSSVGVQGKVLDIWLNNNDVYLLLENHHTPNQNIAVYISSADLTSTDKLSEIFKGHNISAAGKYSSVIKAFDLPAISLERAVILESDITVGIDELTYPKLAGFGKTVLLYSPSGQPEEIPAAEYDEYINAGWTTEAMVSIYAPDGRVASVASSEVDAYLNSGWYSEPVTQMYSISGETICVGNSQIDDYLKVGWYLEPMTLLYSASGETLYVGSSQVNDYLNVGWYLRPVTTLYSPSGSSITVYESESSNYLNVGWYKTQSEAQAVSRSAASTSSASSSGSYNTSSTNRPNSGGSAVYRTPTGKRYHFDPDCGGKNSYRITMDQARSAGLTPCKKCAQ